MYTIPNVSIIVPIYNVEKYLNQCLDSIISQTLHNIEIVLVNDGSTDNSGDICNQYAQMDSRIKVLHQINGGLSNARNNGTLISTGKYITYLDSDDWFEINTCEKAVTLAEEGCYDLVFWQMIKEYNDFSVNVQGFFGESVVFEGASFRQLHRQLAGPVGLEMRKPELIDSFASAWGKLYRKDIIDKNKIVFVDTKIIGSEDILFNLEYFSYAKNAFYVHEHLIHYRKDNATSLTKTHGSTLFPRFMNLFEYMEKFILQKNLGESFIAALNNRICISTMNIGLSEVSPRNVKSSSEKIKMLNQYLNHKYYINSYKFLTFKYFPIHWKIFFLFCKKRYGFGVFFMLKAMRLFIK